MILQPPLKILIFTTCSQMRLLYTTILVLSRVSAETWCGKNYRQSEPVVSPKGKFVVTEFPMFTLRCTPRIQPYLATDDCTIATLLVDTTLNLSSIEDADYAEALLQGSLKLSVDIIGVGNVAVTNVQYNASTEIQLPICGLTPRTDPFTLKCTFETNLHDTGPGSLSYETRLLYMPEPSEGSVTKLDRKTGALLTRSNRGNFEPIFPFGFFTNLGGYLAKNLSILDELKEQGFNVVHPVPPFDDVDSFTAVLDRMEALGLYLMYDSRHSYQQLEILKAEIELIKRRPNLLLWYTADEPDGPTHPLEGTEAAYNLIYRQDGYHPVSLSLNCDDHYFTEYVAGADIILPDIYNIGNNLSYSSRYHTPCTEEFGCCGCDNCQGSVDDVVARMENAHERLTILGWDKTKFLWTVTQAFGGDEFWSRPPTGREWLSHTLTSIMHGARGIIPWIDPTPSDIKQQAARLAKLLPTLSPFIFEGALDRRREGEVEVARWTYNGANLLLAVNLVDSLQVLALSSLDEGGSFLLSNGASVQNQGASGLLVFEGHGAIILTIRAKSVGLEHDEL